MRFLAYLSLILAVAFASDFEVKLTQPEWEECLEKNCDPSAMSCMIVGDGVEKNVQFEWLFNDQLINNDGRMRVVGGKWDQSTLLVNNVGIMNSGLYSCRVKIDGESRKQSVQVNVIERVDFVDSPLEQNPLDRTDARILCRYKFRTEIAMVAWYYKNIQLDEGHPRKYRFEENNQVLVIPDFNSDTDDGLYQCTVIPSEYVGGSKDRRIIVIGHSEPRITVFSPSERTANEGSSISLICQGIGKPAPKYTWYKGESDESLTATDKYELPEAGKLVIHALIETDADSYTCVASNDVGEARNTSHISIFRRPRIEVMENRTATSGEPVDVICRYSGDGEISAEWRYNGIILKPKSFADTTGEVPRISVFAGTNSLTLTIARVTASDKDEYQCVTKNDAGEVHKSVFITIEHAPKLITKTNGVARSVNGQMTEIFCQVSAVPPPTWEWLRPNGDIIESDAKNYFNEVTDDQLKSSLQVRTDDEGDYGEYKCIAKNGVGEPIEASIKIIEIRRPPTPTQLNFNGTHPNYAQIQLDGFHVLPIEQKPVDVIFEYAMMTDYNTDGFDWAQAQSQSLEYESQLKVTKLKPQASYMIRAKFMNEAGESEPSKAFNYTTSSPTAPYKPEFVIDTASIAHSICDVKCDVEWKEPNNGGSPIDGYRLTAVLMVEQPDDSFLPMGETFVYDKIPNSQQHFELVGLQPSAYYEVSLLAFNEIGPSQQAVMMLKTTDEMSSGLGVGSIIGLVALFLVLLLVVIDIICYMVYQCGLLACICVNCFSRSPALDKNKEIAMEEGVKAENAQLLNSKAEENLPISTENGNGTNGHNTSAHKATTV